MSQLQVPGESMFQHLLEPITINGVALRNRVIMGSMHTGLENRASDARRLADFYAERARGGVGLIVTGGYSPDIRGWLGPFDGTLQSRHQIRRHQKVTDAVHEHGSRIALQILHAGRYGHHPLTVAPTALKAPISPFTPRELSLGGIRRLISAYARTARLARAAGYDGVELMGGEGYLINQFLAEATNQRTDAYGGSARDRRRFALEVVRAVRAEVPTDFILMFRLSMADLVPASQSLEEILDLAHELESAGVDVINTDIGWHESRVPTIVTSVPRAAFVSFTEAVAAAVAIPVAASNRINTPEVAEQILRDTPVSLISMARPLLADPDFVVKAARGTPEGINTCIACNQACLDHAFSGKKVSCLVNPRAGRETELVLGRTRTRRSVGVVGAGPAGLSAAVSAAREGHAVTLYEASPQIGGQFSIAQLIPGKEEFSETLRYYRHELTRLRVRTLLNTEVTAAFLADAGHDDVILATGVRPRIPHLPGVDHHSVMTYAEAIRGERPIGTRVAVIGAGGIGVDVCEFLTHEPSPSLDLELWRREWGVSTDPEAPGSLARPVHEPSERTVYLLQRKDEKIGKGLGKTTGWVHRAALKAKGVKEVIGVNYEKVDDSGLHITFGPEHRDPQVLAVDTVILCAGQESVASLASELKGLDLQVHVIGGAALASELDAKRAIRQGLETALAL